MSAESSYIAHELGEASFYLNDYHFKQKNDNGICTLQPSQKLGNGQVFQVKPAEGMFLSTGNWTPKTLTERKYEVEHKMIKIYYLESGDVTLIQNGKKAQIITEGIHLYLNRLSQGRVVYGPNVPISYVSILLFEDYIEKNLQQRFSEDDFDYEQVYSWKTFDYNTPEVGSLFLQIKERLISGETSRLYYESKVGELLSIVFANYRKQHRDNTQHLKSISIQDQKSLDLVRQAIEQNILNPPQLSQLCKISAMGATKLRESFKKVYGVPLGTYIRQSKMKYSLLLLKKPELTISAIADHLGYVNKSKFSAAFRKIYGKSPDQYRKLL